MSLDAAELEKYEYQLSQVKLALAKDPSNAEYISLKDELSDLIDLTKEYLAANAGSSSTAHDTQSPSTSNHNNATASTSSSAPSKPKPAKPAAGAQDPSLSLSLKSGDECQARYSGDGKFYPARITSVGGSDTNRVFSVVFHGYESTEIVGSGDIKPLTETKKRAMELSEADLEKERKRKKNEKKADTRQVKTQEQGDRQKSWQSFAKKGAKKGTKIPGVTGESMFRSPEDGNPNAKVGVVGSGKGMTTTAERKRQTFQQWTE